MKRFLIAAIAVLAAVFLTVQSGSHLIVDHPERSDVVLVLGGDRNDVRYWRGLELLHAGYGRRMVLDEGTERMFGRSYAEHAAEFVVRTAGAQAPSVSVCAIEEDSTVGETADAGRCLAQLQPPPHSVLIVTSDYHTRRAFSIFRRRLPQYRWSVTAVYDDNFFGKPWWKRREWAKTNLMEWQKLLWWELWERWQV